MEIVQGAELARKIFVGRALQYRDEIGYSDLVDEALKYLGLERYCTASNVLYEVYTAKLVAAIGEKIMVGTPAIQGPRGNIRVTRLLNELVTSFVASLTEDDFRRVPEGPDVVDAAALADEFGHFRTALPQANAEATEAWRDLVYRAGEWADDRELCSDFDHALASMGFGEFLLPRLGTVHVTWNGGTFEIPDCLLNRSGKPRNADIRAYLAAFARDSDVSQMSLRVTPSA